MAFQDTLPLPLEVLLPIIAAIASFSVAAAYTAWACARIRWRGRQSARQSGCGVGEGTFGR